MRSKSQYIYNFLVELSNKVCTQTINDRSFKYEKIIYDEYIIHSAKIATCSKPFCTIYFEILFIAKFVNLLNGCIFDN